METALEVAPPQSPGEPASSGGTAAHRFCSLLEKGAIPIGICVSLVALLRFLTYSSRRLWFDEIYTAIIASQPGWAGVWKAYCGGLDMQPPLFFAATRISTLLLGPSELALRFPETLGVLLFSWCMYFFVAKRMGAVLGLCAMILPLVTDLEFYAGEARPYGMLLAFGGLALLAWRNAIDNPRRRVALTLFATALALVAATHAYAIVTVAMFAVAEMVRYGRQRRADWSLWSCFLAALLPLPLYWYGLKTANGMIVGPKMLAHWSDFAIYYHFFFRNRVGNLVLFALLALGLSLLGRSSKPRPASFPLHEAVLMGLLAVFPIFNITLALLINQRFFPRYSIFGMAGIVVVAILLIDALAPDRQVASLALFFLCVFLFGMDQLRESFNPELVKTRDASLAVPYGSVPAGAPLVIATGMAFMAMEMYASDSDLARTFYLTDRDASLRYSGSTIFDTLPNLEKFHHFRGHFADYRSFIRDHKKFYAYGPYVYCDAWQVQKLIDDGASVLKKGRYAGELADNFLFEVEVP
jgi:hypothetical protein